MFDSGGLPHDRSRRRLAALLLSLLIAACGCAPDGDPTPAPPAAGPNGRRGPAPPPATVPPPLPIRLADLPAPERWWCPGDELCPLEIAFDLDLLAPLGDGEGNAAAYLRDFMDAEGSRREEWSRAFRSRSRVETGRRSYESVLPPDHPYLLEAEPWVDQRSCRFYPEGAEIPGVLAGPFDFTFPASVAQSWMARGDLASDPERAKEDYRRVIRLGRLLLQDDVKFIQSRLGHVFIVWGARGLYDLARRESDPETMVAAALVVNQINGIRLRETARFRPWALEVYERDSEGRVRATRCLEGEVLEQTLELAAHDPSRRMRIGSISSLYGVKHAGSPAQRERVTALLDVLMRDPDPLVASAARWTQEMPRDEELLEIYFLPPEEIEAAAEAAGRFSCLGNEPFWNLEIDGSRATYRALAEDLRERRFTGRVHPVVGSAPPRHEWRGPEEPGGGWLVAEITRERCLDTMSDETPPFSWSVRITLPGGEVVRGCCREGTASGE